MIRALNIKNQDGKNEDVVLKVIDTTYIDKIMELQEDIINGLDNKELYAASSKDEFINCIENSGKIIGVVTENNSLIAMGVYMKNGYNDHNYGYDIGLEGEELLKVGQIESTVVRKDYRGNRLQKIICEELEKIGEENNTPIICATASPYNKFSVDTFIKLGYEIKADKIKYGGLRRYVLVKNI